jgi:hypothetical protein
MMNAEHRNTLWLKARLLAAIDRFNASDDLRLLADEQSDNGMFYGAVAERAVMHRFAVHLEEEFQNHGYDLRTNQHFTLKENPLKREHLDDFVACYMGRSGSGVSPLGDVAEQKRRDAASTGDVAEQKRRDAASTSRHDRKETERFKAFDYADLIKRDKINLDIFWLKDDALEESANLPAPGVIALDIMEDLQAALEQFATIAEDLKVT